MRSGLSGSLLLRVPCAPLFSEWRIAVRVCTVNVMQGFDMANDVDAGFGDSASRCGAVQLASCRSSTPGSPGIMR
jgi:hypothetical protein